MRLSPKWRGRHRNGHSLAELLVWIAITGILMAIAIPRLNQVQARRNIDITAQRLASAVAQARTHAAATGTPHRVKREGTTGFRTASNQLVPLDPGVSFTLTSTDSVAFTAFGPPVASAVFFLNASGVTKQVTVSQGGMILVR